MKPDESKYHFFFENLPDAFAYHQLVTGDAGKPVEYIFLEVNPAFEEMTGLKREKIVGKKVTAVLPTIVKSKIDWIYIYGKIAQMEEAIRFEYLLEPSGECYEITACKDAPGFVSVIFRNINHYRSLEKNQPDSKMPELEEVINASELQLLLEEFYSLVKLPVSIIDLKGKVLAGVGWQDICTKYHRVHPETLQNCLESDTRLSLDVTPGKYKSYKCSNNMNDIATPIMVDDKHVGNVFMGQFFFEDEPVDLDLFRAQAQKYGFDEEKYITALKQVPSYSRETIQQAMNYFTKLAQLISQQGYTNLKVNHALVENEQAKLELEKSRSEYKSLVESLNEGIAITDDEENLLYVNPTSEKIFGVEPGELTGKNVKDFLTRENIQKIIAQTDKRKQGQSGNYELELLRADGSQGLLEVSASPRFDGNEYVGSFVVFQDITERKQHDRLLQARFDLLDFSTRHGLDEVLRRTLDEVCAVVDSSIGFYHFVSPDEKMLTLKAWSTNTLDHFCKIGSLSGKSYSVAEAGVWADSVKKREPVIHNDYRNLSHRKGLPDGHAEVVRELVVPIMRDDRIVAILGVGNKARDYDDRDVQIVSYFADLAWEIVERKMTEKELFMQRERLSNILEGANVATWEWNVQTGEHIINERWAEMIGYKLEDIHDGNIKTWHEYTHPEDLEMSYREMEKHFKGEVDFYNLECRRKHKKGHWIWVNDRGKVISWTEDGKPLWVFGTLTDITERKKTEVAIEERLAFQKMISGISSQFVNLSPESLDEGVTHVLQTVGKYFRVDRSYLFRFTENLQLMSNTHEWCAEGIEPQRFKLQDQLVSSLPWWANKIKNHDHVYIPDIENLPPEAALEKKEFQNQGIYTLLCVPVKRDGCLYGFLGFDSVRRKHIWTEDQIVLLKVIAELIANALIRQMNEETIRRLSFNDQLTGLYNRRYFENEIERLDSSREHPIAVISADLDALKLINDTLGHSEGDHYLQAGADLLKDALRESDILARVGGDEFALLLPRTGKTEAELVMNRIRQQINNYNRAQTNLPLSISLGLAVSESPDYSLEEVFRLADNNMYSEKLEQGKKARTEIVSSLLASLFKRSNLAEGERTQVQELSIRLGMAFKLEESRMATLELLAQVYDLGKVGLPDNLLHQSMLENSGELTETEREAIRRHPETGYRIAQASPDLAGVAELILRHHENYDGSGYPLGLKGEKVPVECRILAIAIAYSAMTHSRPYAKTLSHAEALAELQHCAGSQFDPQLVNVFTNMMSDEI